MSMRVAPIALVALFVAGCGGGPAASPSAPPTGTPPATEAPTPTPLDVAAAFKTAFTAMKSGILTMTGQITVGAVQVSMTATNTVSGPDSTDTTTTTVGGVVTTTQHARVAGVRYVKAGNGPWLTDASPASSSDLGAELTRLAAIVTDAGTEQRGSATVHRLATPTGSTLDPRVFGLGGGAATQVAGTVVFFALGDGTPSAVTIHLTWSQPSGTTSVNGELAIDIGFSQLDVPHLIQAPQHVWPVFTSTSNAYRMAYPDDFDTSTGEGFEYFNAPNGGFAAVRRAASGGATLNELTSSEVAGNKTSFKTQTVTNEAATLGGAKARFLTATGTQASSNQKVALYEAIAVHGKYVYYVFWLGLPESAAADLVTFQKMLSTFAFG